jgi:hypothetical protein
VRADAPRGLAMDWWTASTQWLTDSNGWLEPLSYFATIVGVPILLASYIGSLVAESHRREVGTYDTLETQYVDFQKQALHYGTLDVADAALANPPQLNDVERAQQRTLYMVLFSLFERAFLMYRPGLPIIGRILMGRMRRQQWAGWINYIDRYLGRASCREAWFNGGPPRRDVGQDFDPNFESFMWRRLRRLNLVD